MQTPVPTAPRQVFRLVDDFQKRLEKAFGNALKDVQLTGAHAKRAAAPGAEIKVIVLLERAGFDEQRTVQDLVGDLLAERGLFIGARVFDPESYRIHLAPRASCRPSEGSGLLPSAPPGSGQDAIETELTLAQQELAASALLIRHDLCRIALSRMYFAVLRAARAMLYAQGFEPSAHASVLTTFSGSLIRSEHCDAAWCRVLARLHAFRGRADDGDSLAVGCSAAERELEEARGFVAEARRFVSARR